jgi:hypothetical protein
MINDRGELTGTRATLALHLDGHWYTPHWSRAACPGSSETADWPKAHSAKRSSPRQT